MTISPRQNNSLRDVLTNVVWSFLALFVNGFGVYLTIHADIGAGPWDVFNLGLSKTFGILYGNASITVSLIILAVDIAMREPIGLAMFIDAVTVGKTVDFFNWLDLFPSPETLFGSVVLMFVGLVIINVTMMFYMMAALGCGPRDTLLVGLKRRIKRLPIGAINILLHVTVTLTGYLMGGKAGIGTLIFAFCNGPIMQLVFRVFRFDATAVRHQNIMASWKIFTSGRKNNDQA